MLSLETMHSEIVAAAQKLREARAIIRVAKEEEADAKRTLSEVYEQTKCQKLEAGVNVVRFTLVDVLRVDMEKLKEIATEQVRECEYLVSSLRITVTDA